MEKCACAVRRRAMCRSSRGTSCFSISRRKSVHECEGGGADRDTKELGGQVKRMVVKSEESSLSD